MLTEGGGGGTQSFEVVLTQELEVLTILIPKFQSLKRGEQRETFYPVSSGGGGAQNFSDPRFSYFVVRLPRN